MIFILISIIIAITIFILMPKKISYAEMYTSSLFAMVFQLLTDIHLEFKYDLYGYFKDGVDYQTLLIIFFVYPLFAMIFLNHFPHYRSKLLKLLYIIGWTLFALVFELMSVLAGAFYYNGWKLWYSALIYPIVFFIIYVNFLIMRKLLWLNKERNK